MSEMNEFLYIDDEASLDERQKAAAEWVAQSLAAQKADQPQVEKPQLTPEEITERQARMRFHPSVYRGLQKADPPTS